MRSIKVATFNVENLFSRFQFRRNIKDLQKINDKGFLINHLYFSIYNDSSKKITGKAIMALDADVVVLQEVECLDALKKFRTDYLNGRKTYPFAVVLDGNDPRRIDVGILSRFPIVNVNSYCHLWSSETGWYIFSRDCLVADIHGPGNFVFTIFANHFKSMFDRSDPANGRKNTRVKRMIQSQTVKQIVTARFGKNAGDHPFMVLGDLNDYLQSDNQGDTGIGDIVEWDQVENVVDRLPLNEGWTHYFKGNQHVSEAYRQLDYILLSKSLAMSNPQVPYIERRGMPLRAVRAGTERFTGVGENTPKASDHCPLVMELQY